MDWMNIAKGAVAGAIAAAQVDFQSFKSWKTVNDALTYSWSVALFRWVQGAVLGALAAAGLGGIV